MSPSDMKKLFPGYYPMGKAEIDQYWNNATFVVDSVFLLDIFRLNDKDAQTLLDILKEESIKDRLWIPYDVAWVYHNCLNEEILQQITNIQNILCQLTSCKESIIGKKRYPYLNTQIIRNLQILIDVIAREFEEQVESLSQSLKNNIRKQQVSDLFTDHIGEPYDDALLQEIYKQAQERYSKSTPPGFCTDSHPDKRVMFHDLVIWCQMQKYAKDNHRDIIFANGKIREDWFYKVNDKVISPRQELINEFANNTKQRFYCLSSSEFIKKCCDRFKIIIPNLSNLLDQLSENIGYMTSNFNSITDSSTNSIN